MNTYLAYKSNRTYVFQNYIWNRQFYPWRKHPSRPRVPHTPANALLSGPSVGGSWDPSDPAPRSVSERFFEKVCPKHERRIINTRDVKPTIPNFDSGKSTFDTWQKVLAEAPERCIEIQPASNREDVVPQTFDLWFWGSGKANEFWEEFRDSAVSRLLSTSPIVSAAVERNLYALSSRAPKGDRRGSNDPFDQMLAIHIRRGDFKGACRDRAKYNSTFYSWNLLPFLPDKFPHPPGWDVDRQETIRTYTEHCFPTKEFLVQKIRTARNDWVGSANIEKGDQRHLNTLFILTNAETRWLDDLKTMLREDGWHHIVTTKDLELDQQQKDVGMAVDMELARLAAVFIGNGVCIFLTFSKKQRLDWYTVVIFYE